jgi:predicted ATP-grasp superfamily ATP-dependent carboligase
MKRKGWIVFSGNNQRAVLAFCRFAQEHSMPLFIVSASEKDTIYLTDYKRHVVFQRKNRLLIASEIIGCLRKIKDEQGLDEAVILPSTEYLNRFLLRNKEQFHQHGLLIPLVDLDLYEAISDKASFANICREYGLAVPGEAPSAKLLQFPVVVKPRQYFKSDLSVQFKPFIAENTQALETFAESHDISDCFFQEYIEGASYYLLYYFGRGGEYEAYSQENLVQQYGGESMILAKSSSIHEQDIGGLYASLFQSLNFRGLVMVEVKHCNGVYYMIEANPRLWGPSQLILDSGMNLFRRFAESAGFLCRECSERYCENTWYFWSGGLVSNHMSDVPLTYYQFHADEFISQYAEILQKEIYLRSDSHLIYLKENNMQYEH